MKGRIYIIGAYYAGGWNFLMNNGKLAWFFEGGVRLYRRLKSAEAMARKLNNEYALDKVSVFDITDLEVFSVTDAKNWSGRLIYEIVNTRKEEICR